MNDTDQKIAALLAAIEKSISVRLLAIDEEIALRKELALLTCPVKVGDVVRVKEWEFSGKSFLGVVEKIWETKNANEYEARHGHTNLESKYRVYGRKLKKDGTPSKWDFVASEKQLVF